MDLQDIRTLPPGETVDVDICIVGSGPAGLTIAHELAGSAMNVLVLESGGRQHDPWADALNEIESVGAPRVMDQTLLRNRVFGGASSTWSGRTAVFDVIDFARRDWVPNSGWPVTREEVGRYFVRSMQHLGIAFPDNTDLDAMRRVILGTNRLPPFDPTLFRDYFWCFSNDDARSRQPMRFGPRALEGEAENLRCLVNATVTHIDTNAGGCAIEGFEISGPDGQRRRVRCRLGVLCAGGIENARLLLASNRTVRGGLGNSRDLVGRYLMDHPRGIIGRFDQRDHLTVQRLFDDFRIRGPGGRSRIAYGLALAPEVQAVEGLMNCALWTAGPRSGEDPWVSLRNLLKWRGKPAQHLLNVLRGTGLILEGAKRSVVDQRKLLWRMDDLVVECIVEQLPDPESRVVLADRTDAFGIPLSRIDWRVGESEIRTVRRTGQLFVAEMRRLGLPVPSLTAMMTDPEAPFLFPDVAHPTGTTRMSDSAASGVVDTNCAVFGVSGLYVAGSSIFPTSGHANPTQMIVALAIRLADHLKQRIKEAPPLPAIDTSRPRERSLEPARKAHGRALVLVTGASGKLGRVLTPLLVEKGYAVRALTSRIPPACSGSGVEWRVHDLRQADLDFSRDVEGCCAILHLGAEMHFPGDMARTNGEATGALARAAEAAGAKFMAYTSSVSVYGSSAGAVSREDSPVLTADRDVPAEYWNNHQMRTYGRTKLKGELAIRAVATSVEYVIFRPTVVVDVADIQAVLGWSARRRALLGHRRTHHVYVLDVAEAIIWTMERSLQREQPAPGVTVYNLSDESADCTYGRILDEAYRTLEPKPFKPVPELPAALVWIKEYLRYGRGLDFRRPLGLMSFPVDKLYGEGYRHRHGLADVRRLAIERFAKQRQ